MSAKPKLKKVFFIDDDEATNAFHVALSKDFDLAKKLHVFNKAADALRALDSIKSEEDFPELIFVDINMPKIDGHEFTKRVQDMAGYNEHRTCIALLTNSKDIKDVVKADENQLQFYYWKPLKEENLTSVLKRGLGIG